MTTREQAEKEAAAVFPPDIFVAFGGFQQDMSEGERTAFVRGWEAREALLPSVEEVALAMYAFDRKVDVQFGRAEVPFYSLPYWAQATWREKAAAVLALVKGEA